MECNTEIMKIVFTEDGNAPYDVKIIYTFESDRQLKCFVKHYANKQGIPIWSLHLYYDGKSLILSSSDHTSLKALGMWDGQEFWNLFIAEIHCNQLARLYGGYFEDYVNILPFEEI